MRQLELLRHSWQAKHADVQRVCASQASGGADDVAFYIQIGSGSAYQLGVGARAVLSSRTHHGAITQDLLGAYANSGGSANAVKAYVFKGVNQHRLRDGCAVHSGGSQKGLSSWGVVYRIVAVALGISGRSHQ